MTKKYLLIILALSLLTRFVFFNHPAETVFDEVHFGKFVSGYFTGQYFFDIHPPLGKLLIAGMAKISGFQPGFSFETIGQKFIDDSYKWLRFLPKLAGALLPVVVFLIALEIISSDATVGAPTASRRGQKFAFLAGLLLVFENSLIAQSRFILLDSFLLLFGFLGILFFLKFNKTNSLKHKAYPAIWLFLAGVFCALAFSVKWTGLSFLGLILIFYFWNWLKSSQKLKQGINGFIFLILIPSAIYFSIFAVHFSLLPNTGPGLAFHPPNFQEMNVFKKFAGLNLELYRSNTRLGASHPYTSQWFQWPFMNKPIYYWNDSSNSSSKIYFLGNPLIYWLSTLAVIYAIIINLFKSLFTKNKFLLFNFYFLIFGFLINWLPFIFIGRVMFLYHYMASLIFAVLILAYSLDKLKFGNKKIVFDTILTGSIILFFFFSPLTYGLAIPEWYYKLLVWLPAWK